MNERRKLSAWDQFLQKKMSLFAEFFRVGFCIMSFFMNTWPLVIGGAVFFEAKELEQAVPVDFCNYCYGSQAAYDSLKYHAACSRVQVGIGLRWK